MALSPEDVLNKNFTATQFRRGYDEREVDDFLDEVVSELRRLTTENDDLRAQLAECQKGRGAGVAATAVQPAVKAEPKVAAKDGKSEATERALREAREQLTRLQSEAEKAQREAAEQVARTKAEADKARAEADRARAELQAVRDDADKSKGAADTSRAEVDRLRFEAEKARTDAERLKAESNERLRSAAAAKSSNDAPVAAAAALGGAAGGGGAAGVI